MELSFKRYEPSHGVSWSNGAELYGEGTLADAEVGIGAAHEWATSTYHGISWYGLLNTAPSCSFDVCMLMVHNKGHSGEVFATRFDPSGEHIASGSMDRSISMLQSFSSLNCKTWSD